MNDTFRLALLAGSLLGLASPTNAQRQPAARPMSDRAQEAKLPQGIVLASAESAPTPAANAAPDRSTTPKRVAPRITTCRCGDPLPAPSPDEQ